MLHKQGGTEINAPRRICRVTSVPQFPLPNNLSKVSTARSDRQSHSIILDSEKQNWISVGRRLLLPPTLQPFWTPLKATPEGLGMLWRRVSAEWGCCTWRGIGWEMGVPLKPKCLLFMLGHCWTLLSFFSSLLKKSPGFQWDNDNKRVSLWSLTVRYRYEIVQG